jgi:hypothetical protein
MTFAGPSSDYMRILTGGTVGIGTSTPSSYDSRANNLVVGDSGDAGITIFSGASNDARLQFAPSGDTGLNNGLIGYDNANDKMSFATAGTDRMHINSSGIAVTGNVVSTGVSGSSIIQAVGADSNGYADVEIQSTGSTGASRLYFSDTAAKSGIVLYDHNADNMQFHTGGTLRGFYNSTGLTVSANSGSTSHYFTYNENGGEIQLYDNAGNIATLIDQSSNATRILELQDGSTFQIGHGSSNTTGIIEFRSAGFGLAGVIDANANWLFGKSGTAFGTAGVELNNAGVAGKAWITRSGGEPLALNRLTNTGPLLECYNDSTFAGQLTIESDGFAIDGETSHAGLKFYETAVGPRQNKVLADDAIDLGWSGNRWDDVYATNATIQTSDRNEKQDIEQLSEAEQRVAVACKGLLRKFRWKSAVEKKGDDARIHFGIIAQDLQDAFTAEGLDAGRYGMFINSTWTDEETGEERSRMGVRYSELLAFIISAI